MSIFVQFAVGRADNPTEYRGRNFLNTYTLVRSPSGSPYALAVTSADVTGAFLSKGFAWIPQKPCPLVAKC